MSHVRSTEDHVRGHGGEIFIKSSGSLVESECILHVIVSVWRRSSLKISQRLPDYSPGHPLPCWERGWQFSRNFTREIQKKNCKSKIITNYVFASAQVKSVNFFLKWSFMIFSSEKPRLSESLISKLSPCFKAWALFPNEVINYRLSE